MRREVRKIVSVVFSDVAGSTALAEKLDPESLRRAMTRYFEVVRQVHERHGGMVEKFIGDAVMAVFGMPCAHEDDALRAIRAACELRDTMAALNRELGRELEVTLPVRTGVNTGLVLAGDEHDRHPFVGGDTVNVAARLERAAGPGEVLLGEATYRLVRDAVRVQPVAPFVPRGRLAPVAAYRLLEVRPAAAGLTRCFDTPLVGRVGELALLDKVLDQAVARRVCELVAVLGDPGVGKSRLVRAFTERAGERAVVLYGCCPPYGPRAADQVVGQLIAQTAAAAGGIAWQRDSIAADSPSVFRGMRTLLEGLAKARPVVVVVDDIHWADPALLDLIEYLHAVARRAALLLLVTARPQFLDRPTCWMVGAADTTMVLEPLSAADAAELAARLRGPGGLDAATRERIVARAEGNPLVIEELLRFLTDGDGRGSVGGVRSITRQLLELPFPSAIDALVGAELDRLPPEERVVLELASVVGRIFNWTSVAALASAQLRPRVGAILLALARRKLIRVAERELDEDTFAFRHGILHEATYRAVPKRKRAILHARAAEMLAEATGGGASDDEMVGHHLGQAYRYLAQLAGDELPPPTLLVQPVDRPPAGAIP